jgi:hypothetical protein
MVVVGLDFSAGLALPPEAGDPQTDARVLFLQKICLGSSSIRPISTSLRCRA